MKEYNISICYESNLKIKAESIEEAKDIACKEFWEEPGKANLFNLEVEDEE